MLKYVAVAKILKKHKPSVDTAVLRLHYRTTFLMFFIASAFISGKEYFGSPINCYTKGTVPGNVLNIYCFIMSTFSVPKNWVNPAKMSDRFIDYSGFGGLGQSNYGDDLVYHAYYQWVPLVLFFQALMFYTPRFIWKQLEGGLFDVILGGMDQQTLEGTKNSKKHRILSSYMVHNLRMHKFWAWRFIICEILSLVIVVGNIYFTDYFLGGTFHEYGTEVLNFNLDTSDDSRVDPMVRIFPTVAKCNFRSFGPSGNVEVHDSMCVLAINIFNQKVFILLWFWLIFLAVVTGLWMIYRIMTIFSPHVRGMALKYRGRMAGGDCVSNIKKRCDLGDWFLLDQLGRAVEPTVFGEFLRELSAELEATPENEPNPMMFQS